mmetsp:Transcript_15044/g.23996  ORF Transcript_15044/g.23996 Transcript_15044/m.23996 type:complete len:307 (-) Transcript_15044:169-1089(-)
MEGDTILSFVSTPSFAHTHKDAHTHTHTHTHRHTEREREERNGQERINQHIRARMHVCVMHRYCRWRTHSTLRLGTQLNQFYERLQRQEAFYNYYHNNNNSSSSSNHNQHSNRALNDTIEQHSLPRLEHGQRSDRLEKSGGGGGGGGDFNHQQQASRQQKKDQRNKREEPPPSSSDVVVTLGRRLIYSHHIINPQKRAAVVNWAVELGLSGCSKIGWPGVIVVEGLESNVSLYVELLSKLRWKNLTVRGEQTVMGRPGEHLDHLRAFPKGFQEFGVHSMPEFAKLVRSVGLDELLQTLFKRYPPQT